LPTHANEENLFELLEISFSPVIVPLEVECSRLNEEMMTNESFGYIRLKNRQDMKRLEAVSGELVLKNQKIVFKSPICKEFVRKEMDHQRERQIYVRGLNKINGTKKCLRKFFKEFGKIELIHLATHYKSMRFLGFATIEFVSRDTVNKILQGKNEIRFTLKGKKIKCQRKLLKAEIDKSRGSFIDSKYFTGNNSLRNSQTDSLRTPTKPKRPARTDKNGQNSKGSSSTKKQQGSLLKRKKHEHKDYWITKLNNGSSEILGSTQRKGSWKKYDVIKSQRTTINNTATKGNISQFQSNKKYSITKNKETKKILCFSSGSSTKKLTTRSSVFKFPPLDDYTNSPKKGVCLSPNPNRLSPVPPFRDFSSNKHSPMLKPPSPSVIGKKSNSLFDGVNVERQHKFSGSSITSVHSNTNPKNFKNYELKTPSENSSKLNNSDYNPFKGCPKASFDSFLELRDKNRRELSDKQ